MPKTYVLATSLANEVCHVFIMMFRTTLFNTDLVYKILDQELACIKIKVPGGIYLDPRNLNLQLVKHSNEYSTQIGTLRY